MAHPNSMAAQAADTRCSAPAAHSGRVGLDGKIKLSLAGLLVCGSLACNERHAVPPSPPEGGSNRPAAVTPSKPSAMTELELDGMRVHAHFPAPWRLSPEQSDPSAGFAAFVHGGATPGSGRTASLFLDGSRTTTLPSSHDVALTSVLADTVCEAKGSCVELGHEWLSPNGLLVSVRKPHGVYTESWRKSAKGRTVRCGAEISSLGAVDARAAAWLEDPVATREAQRACEALCKSVATLD
jgi:hypothetical protein